MTERTIIDAGPGLNFFTVHKERLLFSVTGALSMPETVRQEIVGKARRDRRFSSAATVLGKLPEKYLRVLSDVFTPELNQVMMQMESQSLQERMGSRKDLGEAMVVAHAVLAAERGKDVIVLIDDRGGRRLAKSQASRLDRLRNNGQPVGSIGLLSTPGVLRAAAGGEHLPDRDSLKHLYGRLRELDDGLVHLDNTDLLSLPCWNSSATQPKRPAQ